MVTKTELMAEVEVYEVADVNLAAYLLCKGFKFSKPPEQLYGKSSRIWTFAKAPNIEKEALNFFNRTAPIDAQTYGEQVRSLLTLVKREVR